MIKIPVLKIIPVYLKKLSDSVTKILWKKNSVPQTKHEKNDSENIIPDASNLIQTNQYNRDKQNLDKKFM